jgi:large subunit ribosomal protein L9
MEVILLERVEKLGAIGDVVNVKNGFARNYLLPNKKALRANEANKKLFEANRARIEAENDERKAEAEKSSKGVEGKTVQLIRQASNVGHLYGSVSARDIAEALEGVGARVGKSQIVLDRPIKAIGVHEVKIALHPEVAVTVKVYVARSPEEADLQAQGVDVLQQMFEEEAAPLVAADLAAGVEPGEIAEAAEPPAEAETETEAEPASEADAAEAPAVEGEDEQR